MQELKNAYNNKKFAKEILTLGLSKASTSWDYAILAKSIASKEAYNDDKWARKIYELALIKSENPNQLRYSAESMASTNHLNDKKWAKEIYERALKEVDDSNEENSLVTALGELSFCTRPPPMSSRSAFCIEVICEPSIALSGNNPGYRPWSRANMSHALAKDCIRLSVFVFLADS